MKLVYVVLFIGISLFSVLFASQAIGAGLTNSPLSEVNNAQTAGKENTASNTNLLLAQNTIPSASSGQAPSPSPTVSPTPLPSDVISIPRPDSVRIRDIGTLIGAVAAALLIFSAILTFLFLIMGGIQWITSGGDKAGTEAARGKIVNSIVGLIIVASAWAIMILVQNFLGIDVFGGTAEIPKPFPEASASPTPTPTASPQNN